MKSPNYNPTIHHRRSIRLKGYDYSQAGLYFVTMCVQNRECLFGEIPNVDATHSSEMVLNNAGQMIEKWYRELENKFADIKCHEMMVMPNHFHCIIENVGTATTTETATVGADLRVGPNGIKLVEHGNEISGEHVGSPLHRVVQWFKTMTTNEYIRGVKLLGWQRFNGKLWQRDYYESIIRNEQSYQRISEYIINNPSKWADDKFHKR